MSNRNYHWSYAYQAPFLPGATAFLDPHQVPLNATVSLTFQYEGVPMIESAVVGPGDNSTTALFNLARGIDERYPDIHTFNDDRRITLQPVAGSTDKLLKLIVTPYTTPPAATLYLEPPVRPAGANRLMLSMALEGTPLREFRVPTGADRTADHNALATEVNRVPFLRASYYDGRFVVASTPGRNLTSGTLLYG